MGALAGQDLEQLALLIAGIVIILVSTVLHRPLERLESLLPLPRIEIPFLFQLRVIGVVMGLVAILVVLIMHAVG